MSETIEHEKHIDPHPVGGRGHPSDGKYIQIALILGVITAAEVATFYVDIGDALIPALMVMMVVKFAMVVAFFMHLRFDNRLFTRLFVAGLLLAVGVYLAFLTSFEFFGG